MQPRWYQTESVDACFGYLRNEPAGGPVIVLPTGAGKSLVLAMIAKRVVEQYSRRVLIVAHRSELLIQNAEKVRALLPDKDVGIYSAGLNERDTEHDIVCCGIQSVHKRAHEFGERHLVLIDEVHLVPSDGEGMYRTFLGDLKAINPDIRFVGLTATPFRTGEGRLTGKDKLFQKIVYSAPLTRLIDEGFLSQVTNQPATATVDTSKLHVRAGEFIASEVESLFNSNAHVEAACQELVALSVDRKSILVFCSGVNHAEHVKKIIEELTGDEVGIVTGQSGALERAATLRRFKERDLRWTVNVDVLTTGFDAPNIDCVAVLRATLSPGLFAQMVGRALRTHPSKTDALILDFGENLKRHGPIDSPTFGMESQKSGTGTGEAVVKICPACRADVFAGSRECECGFVFPPKDDGRHDGKSDQETALLASQMKPSDWYVVSCIWGLHRKRQAGDEAPPTLKISYTCQPFDNDAAGDLSTEIISEWVCLQHEGFARTKAVGWWLQHSKAPVPSTIAEAVSLLNRGAAAMPTHIRAKREGKFWKILSQTIDELPDEWEDEPEKTFDTEPIDEFDRDTDEVPF